MQETLGIIIFCPESHFKRTLRENKAKACHSPRRITEHPQEDTHHVSISHHAAHAILSH